MKIKAFAYGFSSSTALCFGCYVFSNKDYLLHTGLFKYGIPENSNQIVFYDKYSLCYNRSKRSPIWVAERLAENLLKGDVNREGIKFTVDPQIPNEFSAKNSDYFRSGYSRGHLAAAGNYRNDKVLKKQTFYLTNIVPQNFENNEQYWNMLEIFTRNLVDRYRHVYVYSGPAYLPNEDEPGKKFVKYQIIGENEVAVPTHLYKIILTKKFLRRPLLGVFLIPNRQISLDTQLKDFQVPLESVEKYSGVKFFPKLNRKRTHDLCEFDAAKCKLMDGRSFALMYLGRRLTSARTLNYLEKNWKDVVDKQLDSDTSLKALYENKKKELLARNVPATGTDDNI